MNDMEREMLDQLTSQKIDQLNAQTEWAEAVTETISSMGTAFRMMSDTVDTLENLVILIGKEARIPLPRLTTLIRQSEEAHEANEKADTGLEDILNKMKGNDHD